MKHFENGLSWHLQRFTLELKASVALEFAITVPVILALIVALADMGRLIITDSMLQSSLGTVATEFRYLEADERSDASESVVLDKLNRHLSIRGQGWIESEDVTLTVEPVTGTAGGYFTGQSNQLMRYELSYVFNFNGLVAATFLKNSSLIRTVQIVVRNVRSGGSG